MRPTPLHLIPLGALRRVSALAVLTVSLLLGCASAPSVPPVAAPTSGPPAVPSTLPPASRLAAAAAVVLARPAGTAGATLTATVTGSTVMEETRAGWTEGSWSRRSSVVVDGVSSTAGELVAVDGLLHVRIEGTAWRTAPALPGASPEAVRDPADVLVLLRRAVQVVDGPAADLLVATVPLVALTGAEGEGARFEVRLTGGAAGAEAVAGVRGTVPPLEEGGVAVEVDAWWSAEPPPPIVAPRTEEVAAAG